MRGRRTISSVMTLVIAAMCLTGSQTLGADVTYTIEVGDLQDQDGSLTGPDAIALLVADTSGLGLAGLTNLAANSSLAPGAQLTDTNGTATAQIIARFVIAYASEQDGVLTDLTNNVPLNAPLATGQNLWLLWFPSLTSSSAQPGNGTYFGVYRDPNTIPIDGGDRWAIPSGGSTVDLQARSPSQGGNTPQANLMAKYRTMTLDPFVTWQLQYFGCTNCAEAATSADPDGDGLNNQAEYLAGTIPTNSLSGLRIVSVVTRTTDVVVTWATAGGHTNVLQAAAPRPDGSYTNDFVNISTVVITGVGDVLTNRVDAGGATNFPSRYYRIRLAP